ncbi:MAG: hypothetical protein ACFBWO_05975 [Paracoccaceae bacterium]
MTAILEGTRLARFLGIERRQGAAADSVRVRAMHRHGESGEDRRAEHYTRMDRRDGSTRAWPGSPGHHPSGTDSRARQYAEIERGRRS